MIPESNSLTLDNKLSQFLSSSWSGNDDYVYRQEAVHWPEVIEPQEALELSSLRVYKPIFERTVRIPEFLPNWTVEEHSERAEVKRCSEYIEYLLSMQRTETASKAVVSSLWRSSDRKGLTRLPIELEAKFAYVINELADDYDDNFLVPKEESVLTMKEYLIDLVGCFGNRIYSAELTPDGDGGLEAIFEFEDRHLQIIVPQKTRRDPYIFHKYQHDYGLIEIGTMYDLRKWVAWLFASSLSQN